MISLDDKDIALLNRVQRNFPVCHDPFAQLAAELALDKSEIIERLNSLQTQGAISRFGAVVNHKRAGSSTLAALKVPQDRIEDTAFLVNSFEGVNHNYLREHDYNMWFVVTGETRKKVESILQQIQSHTGFELLNLPMEKGYHIDLAFDL